MYEGGELPRSADRLDEGLLDGVLGLRLVPAQGEDLRDETPVGRVVHLAHEPGVTHRGRTLITSPFPTEPALLALTW